MLTNFLGDDDAWMHVNKKTAGFVSYHNLPKVLSRLLANYPAYLRKDLHNSIARVLDPTGWLDGQLFKSHVGCKRKGK